MGRHTLVVGLSSMLLVAGCNGGKDGSPTMPPAPAQATPSPAPTAVPSAYWLADAVVVSSTGGRACGWGTTTGETRSGVEWNVVISGRSVTLDEDMRNWPTDDVAYSGVLTGRRFAVTYHGGSDYQNYVCAFREASLAGSFSADFRTFEGVETLIWGAPGEETIVQRNWSGRRP